VPGRWRADDLFEQVLGQVAQAVLRLALVPLEEDVVEDLPAIEVGGDEGNPRTWRGRPELLRIPWSFLA
jgi:hypothetical protein